jgi:hypothetical protein
MPANKQLGRLLAIGIARLDGTYPFNRISAAQCVQRIAYPLCPRLIAPQRHATGKVVCVLPSPTPDCQARRQQFRPRSCTATTGLPPNRRRSGSSMRASNSTQRNRRARSSDTVSPLPVTMTKATAFRGTIVDLPSKRDRDGRSVSMLASKSDLREMALTLSRNKAGVASINSDIMRLSNSARSLPPVKEAGGRPNAIAQMQRAKRPLPVSSAPSMSMCSPGNPMPCCR